MSNQTGYPLENHKQHKKETLLTSLLIASILLVLQISLPSNNIVASGNSGTQVGGTITSNTTWTEANSPYIITNTIQIPENVMLTIEPGVTVTSQSSSNTMFLINGIIQAQGNATNKIVFDGNGNSYFFKTNHPVAKGFVELDYCIIRDGFSAFWLDNTAYLNLTNSDLSNLSENSYLWYPSQDSYIEYNTFTNTAGIKIGTDDYYSNSSGMVYVRYNLFAKNQGYVINNYASYGLSKICVNDNSFTDTASIVLEVEKTSTTADMDASQNFWGTTNTTLIDSMIYDKNDDASCSSYINYLPILDSPDPNVPDAPTPTPSPTPPPAPTETPLAPTTNPDPSTAPASSTTAATPIPPASPTNLTADPTNPNPSDTTLNPSTMSTIPDSESTSTSLQNNPTQQPVKNTNPQVQDKTNNYTQLAILFGLAALALGAIVYFTKHKN